MKLGPTEGGQTLNMMLGGKLMAQAPRLFPPLFFFCGDARQ